LHHNVDYDVHSFFSGTISPSTPEKTITSGLVSDEIPIHSSYADWNRLCVKDTLGSLLR
jgi:hypothetical protein